MAKKKSTNKEIHQKSELLEDQNKQNAETSHDRIEVKKRKVEFNSASS